MPQFLQQYFGSFFCHDITNFNAANSEMFRGEYIFELLVLFRRGENKQVTDEIHSFPSLKLSKHEIVWKPHTTFFNQVSGDSKKICCHKSVLCTKRENWYYLKYNCYRPLRREWGVSKTKTSKTKTSKIKTSKTKTLRIKTSKTETPFEIQNYNV